MHEDQRDSVIQSHIKSVTQFAISRVPDLNVTEYLMVASAVFLDALLRHQEATGDDGRATALTLVQSMTPALDDEDSGPGQVTH